MVGAWRFCGANTKPAGQCCFCLGFLRAERHAEGYDRRTVGQQLQDARERLLIASQEDSSVALRKKTVTDFICADSERGASMELS